MGHICSLEADLALGYFVNSPRCESSAGPLAFGTIREASFAWSMGVATNRPPHKTLRLPESLVVGKPVWTRPLSPNTSPVKLSPPWMRMEGEQFRSHKSRQVFAFRMLVPKCNVCSFEPSAASKSDRIRGPAA